MVNNLTNNWNIDIANSTAIDSWMDENFYTSSTISNYRRVEYTSDEESKKLQHKGVDVEFDFNGEHYITDEKCAVKYMNMNFPTFAFSISINKRDGSGRMPDWFMREDMINNSYLILYIDKAENKDGSKQEYTTLTKDGIKEMSYILVKKDKIFQFLEEHQLTREKLFKLNDYMIENDLERFPIVEENKDNWRFGWRAHRSKGYVEGTVNVLIRREDLIKISDANGKIYK